MFIEIVSTEVLKDNYFLWLSDYRFSLIFLEKNLQLFYYTISLNSFFASEDAIKFSHDFNIRNSLKSFSKVFLNYYGECRVEIESFNSVNEILEIGYINVQSDKISEIDHLLDYLLKKEQFYWNTISLTKVEARDKQLQEENLIWTLKNIGKSLDIVKTQFLPLINDPIGRLVPRYSVERFDGNSVVSEDSILWLIQNCNALEPSNIYEDNSFLILNRPFVASELLVQNLSIETDINENQIIHGFIADVTDFLQSSTQSILMVLNAINEFEDFKSTIYKSYYNRLLHSIELMRESLIFIKDSIEINIPVTRSHLNLADSGRFNSKHHYYLIYQEIAKWITRSDAFFSADDLFAGAKDISKLYEIYCLFKIIDTLTNELGFTLESSRNEKTHEERDYDIWNQKLNMIKSEYVFINANFNRLKLFYEQLPESLTTVAKLSKGYRPDFILEFEMEGAESKYIIFDAKYKRTNTIEKFDYEELTLKYLHGIGLKKGGYFPILGLYVLNPIIDSRISHYQKNDHTFSGINPTFPLIGRIEMNILPSSTNYLKNALIKILELI